MPYDLHDTIVAIASAPGGAARGIVRLSGPNALECLSGCFLADDSSTLTAEPSPRRIVGAVRVTGQGATPPLVVPGAVLVWPGARSYTRQPSAEFHTIGSAPLLSAIVDELCRCGARPAEPGEFTLRAFLAGRLDLTQAEAVLGVVEARTRDDLDGALDQLAGGLSRPLHALREQLLLILAELEAGLDFADEPIEFIGRHELRRRLSGGESTVAAALAQFSERDRSTDAPRVVLAGDPNVGKSSLFNAIVEQFGDATAGRSLVSPTPGATRDYVSARLDLDGVTCELIDVAGDIDSADFLGRAAQRAAAGQRRGAELRLRCFAVGDALPNVEGGASDLLVATKCDLAPRAAVGSAAHDAVQCSSATGAGIDQLVRAIRGRLAEHSGDAAGVAATAARSAGALREAARALAAARALINAGSDELLAAEVRSALHAVGEVTGAVCADDVLDRVFSQFCIGK
jgi:tRNA modification GTPase